MVVALRRTRAVRAVALAAALLSLGSVAAAHFQDFMARVVHVVPRDRVLQVYVQMPLALALLPQDWQAGGGRPPPPFLTAGEDGRLWVDRGALLRDEPLLRERLGAVLQLGSARGTLEGALIQPLAERDPFTYLPTVESSVGPGLSVNGEGPLELADAVVSLRLRFPLRAPGAALKLEGNPQEWPELAGRAINILRLHREDGSVGSFQSVGPLALDIGPSEGTDPPGARVEAAVPAPDFLNYLAAGFRHVLEGFDHVLFILMLLLGASGAAQFARTSLAFTLGHSITLSAGAWGGLTALAWFAPGVEAAIAATLVVAGVRLMTARDRPLLAPAVFCVGLIHGFGFSFALADAAPTLAGNFVGLLVGFNLGIEMGQIALSLVAAPVLYLLRRYWRSPRFACGQALALPSTAIASFWLLERGLALAQVWP